MRVMLDTNVLISALLFPSERMNALIHLVTASHRLVLSSYIVEEFMDVTARKFPGKEWAVDLLLRGLPYELVYSSPTLERSGQFEIRDDDDYPVLHAAVSENVDVLVTGDRDFEALGLERPKILTPAAFLERYGR